MHNPEFSLAALTRFCALAGVLAFTTSAALAQELELPQPSPKARVEQRVGVTDFAVEYSSPAVRGRPVWGALVPPDQAWRSGANKVTKLTATHGFVFGEQPVPAGAYALYTIPGKDRWTVVLNKDADAWGAAGFDSSQDVASASVMPSSVPFRERLTYMFSNATDDSVRLDLEWERLRVSVPIKVDTRAHIVGTIDGTNEKTEQLHATAAAYLLENSGDLNTALHYANISMAIDPSWSNRWLRAQILAKQGKFAAAAEEAEQADKLGKGNGRYDRFFKADVEKAVDKWKKLPG